MTSNGATVLTAGQLTTSQLRALSRGGEKIPLDDACWPAVEAAARVVEQAAHGEAAVYGVNTGFGKLATTRIAHAEILELQRRLVLSHMCGHRPAACPTRWSDWCWRSRRRALPWAIPASSGGPSSCCSRSSTTTPCR